MMTAKLCFVVQDFLFQMFSNCECELNVRHATFLCNVYKRFCHVLTFLMFWFFKKLFTLMSMTTYSYFRDAPRVKINVSSVCFSSLLSVNCKFQTGILVRFWKAVILGMEIIDEFSVVLHSIFSERELRSRLLYAIARPSVVCLSVVCRLKRSCTLLRRLKFSAMFPRHLVP